MLPYLMEIGHFLIALMGDWVALMSGIASVVLTLVGIAKKWEQVPRWAFWGAAIVCVLLASARVWSTEHRKVLELQMQVDEFKNPNLTCSIDQVSAGRRPEDSNEIAIVALVVSIRNTGAPSSIEQYDLRVRTSGGGQLSGQRLTIPPHYQFTYPNRTIELNPQLDLNHKTVNPVAHNALKRGYLLFAIPGTSLTRLEGMALDYEITFKDINGKQLNCSRGAQDQSGPGNWLDFPGISED
jgi:hypothetical protein